MIYKSVMCLVDDSEHLSKAETHAARICAMSGARLILLHVIEKWRNADFLVTNSAGWKTVYNKWMNEGQELLDRKEEQLRELGLYSIKKELRSGEKGYEMITVAIEQNAGLMVVDREKGWTLKHFLPSSFISKLIEHLPCPILWVT